MDEKGLGEKKVDHRDQDGAQEGKCQEMGDGRKKRTLVTGGSWGLNEFREPRGQRCPGWSQRVDAAGELAREGVVFFLFLKAGRVSVRPSAFQGHTQSCRLPVGFEV